MRHSESVVGVCRHAVLSTWQVCQLDDGPKDVHVKSLEPVTVTRYGKRGIFAGVMKLWISRWGNDLGLSGWTLNAITGVLRRGRHREIV